MYPSDYRYSYIQDIVAQITRGDLTLRRGIELGSGETEPWTTPERSDFIESILLMMPLPVIYLDGIDEPQLFVIDGIKRLRAIDYYLHESFALRDLVAFPELNGKRFEDLTPRLKRRILETEIPTATFVDSTSRDALADVYRRIRRTT